MTYIGKTKLLKYLSPIHNVLKFPEQENPLSLRLADLIYQQNHQGKINNRKHYIRLQIQNKYEYLEQF